MYNVHRWHIRTLFGVLIQISSTKKHENILVLMAYDVYLYKHIYDFYIV